MLIKPYKTPKSLPSYFLYGKNGSFNMGSFKDGKVLGRIKTSIKSSYSPQYTQKCREDFLYINALKIFPFARNNGLGSKLLNFAKKLSYQKGLGGKIKLLAYNSDTPSDMPHKFYWKNGFITDNPRENKIIAEAIASNTPLPAYMSQGTDMWFYP